TTPGRSILQCCRSPDGSGPAPPEAPSSQGPRLPPTQIAGGLERSPSIDGLLGSRRDRATDPRGVGEKWSLAGPVFGRNTGPARGPSRASRGVRGRGVVLP